MRKQLSELFYLIYYEHWASLDLTKLNFLRLSVNLNLLATHEKQLNSKWNILMYLYKNPTQGFIFAVQNNLCADIFKSNDWNHYYHITNHLKICKTLNMTVMSYLYIVGKAERWEYLPAPISFIPIPFIHRLLVKCGYNN